MLRDKLIMRFAQTISQVDTTLKKVTNQQSKRIEVKTLIMEPRRNFCLQVAEDQFN